MHNQHQPQRGFTLIEIMVVIAIMGVLIALVSINVRDHADQSRITAANADLRTIDQAITMYSLKNGAIPDETTGLSELSPEFTSTVGTDPWGNEYMYVVPGESTEYDLFSFGADGAPGGEGKFADIYVDR